VKPDLKTLPDSKSRMQVSAQQDSCKITSFPRKERIELECEVGWGTSFRVILPMHYA
jgi:hypothetical protein